jgi:hypothetical protein
MAQGATGNFAGGQIQPVAIQQFNLYFLHFV